MRAQLGTWDLVLFNFTAVVSVRWLAMAAHVGPSSLTLWALGAILFFVPTALAVGALSRIDARQGGLYVWTKSAYGDWHAFLCGWFYWLSNLFYFPSLVLLGLSIALPRHGGNPAISVPLAVGLLGLAVWLNVRGLSVAKWLGNAGGAANYVACGMLVAGGAAAWLTRGARIEPAFLPELNFDRLNFWSQITFAFAGLELGAILGGEIRHASKTISQAAWISAASIAVFYIAGTAAMLILLAPNSADPVTGLEAAGGALSSLFAAPALKAAFLGILLVSLAGQVSAWMGGSARLPFVMGMDSYLPAAFARLHPAHGTPYVAIVTQGAASVACLLLLSFGESVRALYQLLVDMTILVYSVPFLYLFGCAWRAGLRTAAVSGFVVTLIGMGCSMTPPGGGLAGYWFVAKLIGGAALLTGTARICYMRGRK